jgi:glycosyltransferase involved in cell wall biosynthesis
VIPEVGADPYPTDDRPRVLFAGNIYRLRDQPEANRVLSDKLNTLGAHLVKRGIRLYFLGTGNTRRLDRSVVTLLGHAPYDASWDYLRFATVGIVVAAGPFMHNNESTKIYHYLRAGLPVVSEAGFPNDHVVTASGLGEVVPNGDMAFMAERVDAAVQREWDREAGVAYVLANHTWDSRAAVYDRVIRAVFR